MQKIKRLLAAALIVLCASCMTIPSNAPTMQAYAAPAKKIAISKKSVTMQPGKTIKLKLKNTAKKPKWKSSNKKIATVKSSGKVTAKKAGKATITAKLAKKSYKCKITVKAETPAATETPGKTETPGTTEDSTAFVWLSASGTKYHKINNCGTMNPATARKISLSEAKEKGYTPCSKCF